MSKLRKAIKAIGIIGDVKKSMKTEKALYSFDRLKKGKAYQLIHARISPTQEKKIEDLTISKIESTHGPEFMGTRKGNLMFPYAPQTTTSRKSRSIERARKYVAGERAGIMGIAFSKGEKEAGATVLSTRVIPQWIHNLIAPKTTQITHPLGRTRFQHEKREEAARRYLKKKGKSDE